VNVKVKWDFGGTDLEDQDYHSALVESGLPEIVKVPTQPRGGVSPLWDQDAFSDWLSDQYGFTHFGWVPITDKELDHRSCPEDQADVTIA
jgi:hypothetical protein